jgi:hypothetical protein
VLFIDYLYLSCEKLVQSTVEGERAKNRLDQNKREAGSERILKFIKIKERMNGQRKRIQMELRRK